MTETEYLWPESPHVPRTPALHEDAELVEVQDALRPLFSLLRGHTFSHSVCLMDGGDVAEERRADLAIGPDAVPVSIGVRSGVVMVVVQGGYTLVETGKLADLLHLNHGRAWKARLDDVFEQEGNRLGVIMLEGWFHGVALTDMPELVMDGLMQRGLYAALIGDLEGRGIHDHLD